MVAARAASRAPDATIAAELGSLFYLQIRIASARWRLRALVQIAPALRRFDVPLDRLQTCVHAVGERARCPLPLRTPLVELLDDSLAHASGEALAWLADALFARSWASAATCAVTGALACGVPERAAPIIAAAPSRYLAPRLRQLVRRGYLTGGEFVGDVRAGGSEHDFLPSLPLAIAVARAICATGDVARLADADRLAKQLRPIERDLAFAHLACCEPVRVRSIRAPRIRDHAHLLLVRSAIAGGRLDLARERAGAIGAAIPAQRAWLELARAHIARRELREAVDLRRRIDHPLLATERELARLELVMLANPRHAELPALATRTRDAATWLASLQTLAALRRGDLARALLAAACADRRALLATLARAGIPDAHDVLGSAPLAAEHVAMRAERLLLVQPGVALHAASDGNSLERALYDEAIAYGEAAPQQRRVLISAARSSLRAALERPAERRPEVVEARLRTLVHLGGKLARDAIAKPLAMLPLAAPHAARAIEALAALDPVEAARIVLARIAELRAASIDVAAALARIEQHGGVPRGFTQAFAAARAAIARCHGDARADAWLSAIGDRLDPALLGLIAQRAQLPASPTELLAELDQLGASSMREDHVAFARRIAREPGALEALLVAERPRVDPRMPAWATKRWRGLVAKIADEDVEVDRKAVHQFARRFGYARHFHALLCGDLTAIGAMSLAPILGTRLRLRLLDKRRDLLTYLRFPDVPARSCMRSDSWMYIGRDVVDAWRDPLTFCVHVEHGHGDGYHPCGFVFGGFAEVDGELAIVANSLHVRPATREVRCAVVRGLEQALCEPLGIRRFGIANDHGGRGPLPDDYVEHEQPLVRLRALSDHDFSCDDVTCGWLWWRAGPPVRTG